MWKLLGDSCSCLHQLPPNIVKYAVLVFIFHMTSASHFSLDLRYQIFSEVVRLENHILSPNLKQLKSWNYLKLAAGMVQCITSYDTREWLLL